jgi:hypothetical protein
MRAAQRRLAQHARGCSMNWEVPYRRNSAVFGGRKVHRPPSLGWGLCTCLLLPEEAQSHCPQPCQTPQSALGPAQWLAPGLPAVALAPLLGSPSSLIASFRRRLTICTQSRPPLPARPPSPARPTHRTPHSLTRETGVVTTATITSPICPTGKL